MVNKCRTPMSLLFSLNILSTAERKVLKFLSGLRVNMSLSIFSSVNTYFIHFGAFIKNTFYSVSFIVTTVTTTNLISGQGALVGERQRHG